MNITTRGDLNAANNRIEAITFLMELDGVDDLELIELQTELEMYVKALRSAYIFTRKRELGLKLLKGGA